MKKIKSPWYGVVWMVIWTAALIWFLTSGRFDERESIGLFLVWLVLVGTTVYVLIQRMRFDARTKKTRPVVAPSPPSLNAACQCGSGKKSSGAAEPQNDRSMAAATDGVAPLRTQAHPPSFPGHSSIVPRLRVQWNKFGDAFDREDCFVAPLLAMTPETCHCEQSEAISSVENT